MRAPTFDTEAPGADVEVMASSETEPPPAHPSAKSRKHSSLFIAAFVLLQFVIPLTYLVREDSSDDRFTWRSFTAIEAPSCETRVSLERPDGRREAIDIQKTIHPDWLAYVQKGRRAVVEAFLQKQCEPGDVLEVELVNSCDSEGGTQHDNIC